MTVVRIFSTNYYGGTVEEMPQAAERIMFTDQTHPIAPHDPRIQMSWWRPSRDMYWGRLSAAWWGHHPHIGVPDADVTVMIGNNFRIQVPDLAERCLEELGDDDMLLLRHPERDCIYEEAEESAHHKRWTGSRQNVRRQAAAYRRAGHPAHWGLFHAGMIVRRNTPAMRAFDDAWWQEYKRWTSQDQISLPPLLRTSDLKWHAWPDVGQWHALPYEEGWVRWRDKVGNVR